MSDTKVTLTRTVTEENLAVNVGSGSLRVLATPWVAAWFENAAMKLAAAYLEPGSTTVGCSITVNHTAPSRLGAQVTVTAELVQHTGRLFDFVLTAADGTGEIATGVHQRAAVYAERFQQKADARK